MSRQHLGLALSLTPWSEGSASVQPHIWVQGGKGVQAGEGLTTGAGLVHACRGLPWTKGWGPEVQLFAANG